MSHALRILRQLPLALLAPVAALISYLTLALTDLLWVLLGRARRPKNTMPDTSAASVVIPNWNGRDLLEKYLPSVLEAMAGNARNEVIVVDNGSTDGSADFVRSAYPRVKLVALKKNLGFGGGSNRGFREASNDIVVLLNSDMRVAPDFLKPLLDSFTDETVFAVSCQIFFSDPAKKREETGLTQGTWSQGALRVRHRLDDEINVPYPCFYGGGGSCAFDRRKFLELGGFDELLKPFYLEDTDIGYLAWKRGWKVFYQPASHVWHEHRGTIGKKFSREYIDGVVSKNFLLFTWKNIHKPGWMASHFAHALAGAYVSMLTGPSPERASLSGMARAFLQLPQSPAARWRARSLAVIDDVEAFRRPMGGYFRDRFEHVDALRDKLGVLFVSPYAVCPPVHGGGVFMHQTIRQLGPLTNLHLIALLDARDQIGPHQELAPVTRSMQFMVRMSGQPSSFASAIPAAVREFSNPDLEWMIHRTLFLHKLDVLQLEYTNMGQYTADFRQIACVLFEHDVFFQSIGRGLPSMPAFKKFKASWEYLRALRFELKLLPTLDRVQTCTAENKRYLLSFLPGLKNRIDDHVRAGIDVSEYGFEPCDREPCSMLFLGSFRHSPNTAALNWFLRNVMPHVLRKSPDAKLLVIGSDPPPVHTIPTYGGAVEILGFVPDIHEPMRRASVFVCPILSGSGIRVKLLEAFACGIPVVSTRVGAEGLGDKDGTNCRLADTPEAFAQAILDLFEKPGEAEAMARRAREHVLANHNMPRMARELEQSYRSALTAKARR